MKHRITEILASESATTAATKTTEINILDPISRITIQFKGTNNGATPTAHPAKMISKIELVDGSDILFSLSGREAQAVNYYNNGVMPVQVLDYRDNVMAIFTCHLDFGRYLWDRELALDPSRFANLQLKITHNKALGGSVPDAGTLAVFAHVFEPNITRPRGFLMSKEVYSYALTSSAHEYITLPTDHSYRNLFIASLSAEKQPWEQYNKIKLTLDNDKTVLINNMRTSDLLKVLQNDRRVVETILGTGTASAVEHFISTTYDTYVVVGAIGTALASVILEQTYGGSLDVTADNTEDFQSIIQGLAPHGAIAIPFGKQDQTNDFLDLNDVGNITLDITAGSSVGSSSTAEIFLQQLRQY